MKLDVRQLKIRGAVDAHKARQRLGDLIALFIQQAQAATEPITAAQREELSQLALDVAKQHELIARLGQKQGFELACHVRRTKPLAADVDRIAAWKARASDRLDVAIEHARNVPMEGEPPPEVVQHCSSYLNVAIVVVLIHQRALRSARKSAPRSRNSA